MKTFKNSDGFAMNMSYKEACFIKYLLQTAVSEEISDRDSKAGKATYKFLQKMLKDMGVVKL